MNKSIYRDYSGKEIELPEERWNHITKEHPEIKSLINKVGDVLANPDHVKLSKRDKEVFLYYRFYPDIQAGKYLLIVVKKGRERSFVLTGYITNAIRKGDTLWERK